MDTKKHFDFSSFFLVSRVRVFFFFFFSFSRFCFLSAAFFPFFFPNSFPKARCFFPCVFFSSRFHRSVFSFVFFSFVFFLSFFFERFFRVVNVLLQPQTSLIAADAGPHTWWHNYMFFFCNSPTLRNWWKRLFFSLSKSKHFTNTQTQRTGTQHFKHNGARQLSQSIYYVCKQGNPYNTNGSIPKSQQGIYNVHSRKKTSPLFQSAEL